MAKVKLDNYANKAFGVVAQTVINTLVFAQIQMGVGLFEGKAMLLHRVRWAPNATSWRECVAATDRLTMAICTSNRITTLNDIGDPAIIDFYDLIPVGATVTPAHNPIVSDYTQLPNGGKLIPANPLWVGMWSAGFAAVSDVRVELEFTFVELAPAEYLELLQAMYPANIS